MLPEWLAAGLGIAGLLAVAFAGLFALGERLFPTAPGTGDREGSGEWKRRAEIREYLGAIGEPYAEDHPVAGHAVAFYLPERDVAITFDARAYFRIEGTQTYPILVEHEMPGAALGARLPFEVPAVDGFGSRHRGVGEADAAGGGGRTAHSGDTGPAAGAYRVLGLEPGATREEVRRAYRERVKEVHPDHGGDEADFRRVREAYATARRDAP